MNISDWFEVLEAVWEKIINFTAAVASLTMMGGIFAILTAHENAFHSSSQISMISFTVGSISLLAVSNFSDEFSYRSESEMLRSSRYFLISGILGLLYAATNAMITGDGGLTVLNILQQYVAALSTTALIATSATFAYASYRLFYAVRKMRTELDATE